MAPRMVPRMAAEPHSSASVGNQDKADALLLHPCTTCCVHTHTDLFKWCFLPLLIKYFEPPRLCKMAFLCPCADCHLRGAHGRPDHPVRGHPLFRTDPVRGLRAAFHGCLILSIPACMSGDLRAQHLGMLISTRARGRICPLAASSEERTARGSRALVPWMDGWMDAAAHLPGLGGPQPGWLRMLWTIWWMWGSKKVLEAGEREREEELKPSES